VQVLVFFLKNSGDLLLSTVNTKKTRNPNPTILKGEKRVRGREIVRKNK